MRIFVSSTFRDLRPERQSAQEALHRSELVPWGMELFVSELSKSLDVCLEQVQLSDAVILIVGFMAGSLIPESPELTYTRAEFELAQRLGRPVFAFFKTEGGVAVNKETNADKKKALVATKVAQGAQPKEAVSDARVHRDHASYWAFRRSKRECIAEGDRLAFVVK